MTYSIVLTRLKISKLLKVLFATLLLSALVLSTGCMSLKSYVDPALPKVNYSDLKPKTPKHSVQFFFEFKTKDSTNVAATKQIHPIVVSVLERSNLFSQVLTETGSADRKLYVTVTNVAITKDAYAKGFGTGLTLGLVGTMVTDGYTMIARYKTPDGREIQKTYNHALHSTIGNASGPPNLQAMEPKAAISKVMEELMLKLLSDLSREGSI